LADYRDHYHEIRASGASLVAVSVDPPEASEAMRSELRLLFPILCDTARRMIQEWDIYNPRERGGIARPAVFIINSDRTVRYASVDGISNRTPAAEILGLLPATAETSAARRKHYIPTPADFFRGIRNAIRFRPPAR
jgi:peroxiredoxin